jgi:nucleotide-binding universal stress UspA family protein
MQHTLYATDGSEAALAGARLLARLPWKPDWSVTLLTVLPGAGAEDGSAAQAAARETLHAAGIPTQSEVRYGNPAEEILRLAESSSTDLIVVGSRGMGAVARFLLGSVAERVARHASCPVLVARPLVNDLRLCLLAFDGSEEGEQVVERFARFPLPDPTMVRIVTVMPFLEGLASQPRLHWPVEIKRLYEEQQEKAQVRLDALEEQFRRLGRPTSTHLRPGDPASVLLDLVTEDGADLIAVGSSGMGAIERFLLGSVSTKVLQHAPCSVLIVKGRSGTPSRP